MIDLFGLEQQTPRHDDHAEAAVIAAFWLVLGLEPRLGRGAD